MGSRSEVSIEDDDFFVDNESHHDNLSKHLVSDLDREWKVRHNQFHTVGYREGLLAGKESSVQEGFNNGFRESVLAGYNWGLVRGITSSFACLPEHVKEKLVERSEAKTKLEILHGKVHSISGKDALKLFHEDVLKGELEAQIRNSDEGTHGDLKESRQILEVEEQTKSSPNADCTNELSVFHRQMVSILESTTLRSTFSS